MTAPREGGTIGALTAVEWEQRLTAHYLREDGLFGGAPLRYLDATPAEIASAAGFEAVADEEAQDAFLAQFDIGWVADWLGGRRIASPYGETPGYFRYLVLTAMVTATDTGAGSSHNFRTRLGRLLGHGHDIQAVTGVNDLWNSLVVWATARREAGRPIRPIILPEHGRANRIGIAVQIAFPSWRDRQELTRILTNISPQVRRSVSRLTRELARPHYDGICSPNLSATFHDFAAGLAAGRADLADHRFWRLVESVEQRLEDRLRASELTRWTLSASFEGPEQDAVTIEVRRRDARGHDRSPMFQGPFESFAGAAATRLPRDLVRLREGGHLILGEAPGALWTIDDLGTSSSRTVVVLARGGGTVHRGALATVWTPIGAGWVASAPMSADVVVAVLRELGLTPPRREDLVGLRLVDGVATRRGSWLGRPGFLPRIVAPEGSRLSLDTEDAAKASLALVEMRLATEQRLTGRWHVRAESGGEVAEQRFYLEADASERDTWPTVVKAFAPIAEVEDGPGAALGSDGGSARDAPAPLASLDLMEAVYARGTASMPEGEFAELVGRTLPDRRRVWDVMRAFAEAGWAEVSASSAWRARRWTLCPPKLVALTGSSALVEGALCAVSRRRLGDAVAALGGHLTTDGVTPWSPDVVVVSGASPSAVAAALSWACEAATPLRLAAAPGCWPAERRTTEGREISGGWSFELGMFLREAEAEVVDGWRLERWSRPRGDDRDLYRLVGREAEWLTTVRSAAILEAHRRVRRPLFVWSEGALRRRGASGHLPLPVARTLRRIMLRQTGATTESDGRPSYRYPAGAVQRDWLVARFGAAIGTGVTSRFERSWVDRAVESRRGGRPLAAWPAAVAGEGL